MGKLIIITFFIFFSIPSIGQKKVIKGKMLPPVKDTVFIGVSNILKLQEPFINPVHVESSDGSIRFNSTEVFITPRSPGKIDVIIKYKDTIVKRSFVSTYLPKPIE